MEDNAIMLPSGCALACISLVFGIKWEFHQNGLDLHFYSAEAELFQLKLPRCLCF